MLPETISPQPSRTCASGQCLVRCAFYKKLVDIEAQVISHELVLHLFSFMWRRFRFRSKRKVGYDSANVHSASVEKWQIRCIAAAVLEGFNGALPD